MTWCVPVDANRIPTFQGQSLIVPVVSVGSVPQLAIDLLIRAPSLECHRVAYLEASECVPFVSPSEPGDCPSVYTPLDGMSVSLMQSFNPMQALRSCNREAP